METTTHQQSIVVLDHRISWSAIFGGVIIGLGISVLLNILGLALGFNMFKVDSDLLANLGTGSIIWLITSTIIATFAGGWIAGRLADIRLTIEGMLHGLATWALITLTTFMLITTAAGSLVNSTLTMVEKSLAAVGKGVTTVATGVQPTINHSQIMSVAKSMAPNLTSSINQVSEQFQQLILQFKNSALNQHKLEELIPELQQALTALFSADSEADVAQAKQKLAELLVQNSSLSPQQAEQQINEWYQKYSVAKEQFQQNIQQVKKDVIDTAEYTSDILAKIALVIFFTLLIGGIAGATGGMLGTNRRV